MFFVISEAKKTRNKKVIDANDNENMYFFHCKTFQKPFLSKIGKVGKSISHKVWMDILKYLRYKLKIKSFNI